MDMAELAKRLQAAATHKSLRELGRECGVSHELIRKLLCSKEGAGITVSSYNKISEGLKQNGF